jgi:hypothetical protein
MVRLTEFLHGRLRAKLVITTGNNVAEIGKTDIPTLCSQPLLALFRWKRRFKLSLLHDLRIHILATILIAPVRLKLVKRMFHLQVKL